METKQLGIGICNMLGLFGINRQRGETAVVTYGQTDVIACADRVMSPQVIPTPQLKSHPELKSHPVYSYMQHMQLVSMLAATVERGIDTFSVSEQFGRVYLVSFEPIAAADPLLPFVFRDYGRPYRKAYQTLVGMFMDFAHMVDSKYLETWDYYLAKKQADRIIEFVQADSALHVDEKNYLTTRLLYAISMPNKAIQGNV